jgi:hypothetical protein
MLYSVFFLEEALTMGKVLQFKEAPPDNLITLKPWEFRAADWESRHFIQMLKSQATNLEKHRKEERPCPNSLPTLYSAAAWLTRSRGFFHTGLTRRK